MAELLFGRRRGGFGQRRRRAGACASLGLRRDVFTYGQRRRRAGLCASELPTGDCNRPLGTGPAIHRHGLGARARVSPSIFVGGRGAVTRHIGGRTAPRRPETRSSGQTRNSHEVPNVTLLAESSRSTVGRFLLVPLSTAIELAKSSRSIVGRFPAVCRRKRNLACRRE